MAIAKALAAACAAFALAVQALPQASGTGTVGLPLPSSDPASSLGSSPDGLHPPHTPANPLLVDLTYSQYNGVYNSTSNLYVWKGIRYAAPPTGANRWQVPKAPAVDRTSVKQASAFGSVCPQAFPAVPGVPFVPGDEDCLFLNVWAPANKTGAKLRPLAKPVPVLVWIHGGGYGLGDGTQDMTEIINANNNGFLVVSIQYRLGAFGFLSSQEVKNKGLLNAGLLDQKFAFQWIQKYITLFGGDPTKVTISGESAGAGAVMLHAIAGNGNLGSTLWQNGIAASPYDPGQYNYNAAWPTTRYYNFSSMVGCGSSGNVFNCLVGKDTLTLQYANANLSIAQVYGTWAFLPVTDGTYITGLPSVQLNAKKVNGKKLLIGNNANEGALFVPPTIVTLDDLKAWLGQEFPNFSAAQIQQVLDAYPSSSAPDGVNDTKIETDGVGPPYAVNVSQVATGQQQRANNILAEATFVCPSYWMGTAFAQPGKAAYHYQYSVPFASHGADVTAYFGPAAPNQDPRFVKAFRQIWGNFVTAGDPSIASSVATGGGVPTAVNPNPASVWPQWTDANPRMVNLNETGGVPYQTPFVASVVTQYMDPGLKNDFTLANAYTWEGGRGQRCDFWKTMGPTVPA